MFLFVLMVTSQLHSQQILRFEIGQYVMSWFKKELSDQKTTMGNFPVQLVAAYFVFQFEGLRIYRGG